MSDTPGLDEEDPVPTEHDAESLADGAEPDSAEPEAAEPDSAELDSAEPDGAELDEAESAVAPSPKRPAKSADDADDEDGELLSMRKMVIIASLLLVAYVFVNFLDVWTTATNSYEGDAQAAIVLGAAQYNGTPSGALQGRLDTAGELWQQERVPIVVVTGGRQETDVTSEASAGADYLISTFGIPDEDILREVDGRTTYESVAASARFLRERGVTDVIMVTDPYHAARAELVAEEVGLNAKSVPTNASISGGRLVSETVAVSLGRIFSFRRLDSFAQNY